MLCANVLHKLDALGNRGNDRIAGSVVDLTAFVGFLVNFFANTETAAASTDYEEKNNTKNYPADNFPNSFELINAFITSDGSIANLTGKLNIGYIHRGFQFIVAFLRCNKQQVKIDKKKNRYI